MIKSVESIHHIRRGIHMDRKKKKALLISVGAICLVACIATAIVAVLGMKKDNGTDCTVSFELCTDLKTSKILDKSVTPGSFLEEPEVYVLEDNEENWEITGWYREPAYEIVWDYDFDTVTEDVTLYARWETNPQCTVQFKTKDSEDPVTSFTLDKGLVVSPCDEKFVGREVLGYYTDPEMKHAFDFNTKIEEDMTIWVDVSDYIYFTGKEIAKWNLCGNQSEAQAYESSVQASADDDTMTISTKHGGYLWLKELALDMNGTSIIEVKMREINGDYTGNFGGYVCGSYEIDKEPGVNGDFGQDHTGPMFYSRSEEPDEDGFYTYTCNTASLTPGLLYTELNGLRIDFWDSDEDRNQFIYEIKELRSRVDPYAVSGKAFKGNGIDFTALHMNTFLSMANASTEMVNKNVFRFGGSHGANIYKKELEISMGSQQIIELKAKGDLKGGSIVMYLYGDYEMNGKAGSLKDFAEEHKLYFTPGSVDTDGYTTYTAYIGSIAGLSYKTIRGLRIDLYGEGTRSLDIISLKSKTPTKEEFATYQAFNATGLKLTGANLAQFIQAGEPDTAKLSANGDYRFGGKHGVFIYKKDMNVTLKNQQRIVLKAKGDLNNGLIALYLYGTYTKNGKQGENPDYTAEHRWDFVKGATDKDGYTTYTVDINSIPGLQYSVIKGLRIDLYGEGKRTIDIKSVTSVEIPKEEAALDDAFNAKKLNLTGAHFTRFIPMGSLTTKLKSNGDFVMNGKHGSFIHRKNLSISLGKAQTIEIKAKGNLNGGVIGMYLYGDYTKNGKKGSLKDYSSDQYWIFHEGATDKDGYATYTVTLSEKYPGLTYKTIKGIRLELWGEKSMNLSIRSMKAVYTKPEKTDKNNYLYLSADDLSVFYGIGAEIAWNADRSAVKVSGAHGAFIHMKELNYNMPAAQTVEIRAKVSKGTRVGVYMYGDYTQNKKAKSTSDYGEHVWTLTAGETDKDGYTSLTFDIEDGYPGLVYKKVKGFRIDLWDTNSNTLEIKYVKALETRPVRTEQITVNYYVKGTKVLFQNVKSGATVKAPTMEELGCQGGKICGYYTDEAMTKAFDFKTKIKKTTNIYVDVKNYLFLSAESLSGFYGIGATATMNQTTGSVKISGGHGGFIYMKELDYLVPETQKLEMKAKVSEGTRIIVYLMGTYKKDQKEGTITDYTDSFYWQAIPTGTDADGYTTYVVDLSTGHEAYDFQTITGFRVELQGQDTNTAEILYVMSAMTESTMLQVSYYVNGTPVYAEQVKPGMAPTRPTNGQLGVTDQKVIGFYSDEACQVPYDFSVPLTAEKKIYVKTQPFLKLTPNDLATFYGIGATTKWSEDGTALIVSGGHGAFIHMIQMEYALASSQKIEMKAKVSEGTNVIIYVRGTYRKNGQTVTIPDYTGEQYWLMTPGETDADGYTTYTMNLQDGHEGCEYLSIEGFRIELQGDGQHRAEIRDVRTVTE